MSAPETRKETWRSEYLDGLRGGAPIGAGYFAVSLALGLMWARAEYPPIWGAIMALSSMSATGGYATTSILIEKGMALELVFTTILVNLRYVLMSLALSQRLEKGMGTFKRMIVAMSLTDEEFAVSMTRRHVTLPFSLGVMTLPMIGWSMGTYVGAVAGDTLPSSVRSAAGILLFGMFVAIVVPPATKDRNIFIVATLAIAFSVLLFFIPGLASSWRIIIASVAAAAIGATFLPVKQS